MGSTDGGSNHTPNSVSRQLTGDEAALYDRQIRLWGLEAQQRLASSSVLLLGDVCGLLGQEIAKNVVLAGVARLGLAPQQSSETRAAGGFLGRDLAATIASLQDMNPHVDVHAVDGAAKQLASFSIVCAIGLGRRMELEWADLCRGNATPFMAGRTAGFVGWVFVDFGDCYKFQARKSASTQQSAETVEQHMAFCDYSTALKAPWGAETRRSEFGWHVACCLLEFEDRTGRLPGAQPDDTRVLSDLYGALCEERRAANRKMDLIEGVAKTAHVCLPPLAAIVGGIWAREVIKFVSGKDEPLNNFFFFNARTSAGSVERVGASV